MTEIGLYTAIRTPHDDTSCAAQIVFVFRKVRQLIRVNLTPPNLAYKFMSPVVRGRKAEFSLAYGFGCASFRSGLKRKQTYVKRKTRFRLNSLLFCDKGPEVLWQENYLCEDDKSALEVACMLQRADAKAIEIWEGGRWVDRLKPDYDA